MTEVARLAGVSISTVSVVLNASANVSEELSRRVREAMSALDYHPDIVARSLKTGKTKTIGVVIPDITNIFYPELICGIEDAARNASYGVLLCNSNEDPAQEQCHLNTLFSRRVDGVLLACSSAATAYGELVRRRFPLVFVDRIPVGVSENGVSCDNIGAGQLATRHLIELGHKRIAILAGNTTFSPHAERLEGFRRAMQAAPLPVQDEYLRAGEVQVEEGHRTAAQLLALTRPPTAVVACNPKLMLGLLQAMREFNLVCPADISVVGFDDSVWNECYRPRLTTVVQPTYDMGRQAFETLHARMESVRPEWNSIVRLSARLCVRESTAPPAEG